MGASYSVKPGTTDVTIFVSLGVSSTGIAFNSATLKVYYIRPGGSLTQISTVTQTVAGAHSDGGWVELSSTNAPGRYRLDLPDAVCAVGVGRVRVMVTASSGTVADDIDIDLTRPATSAFLVDRDHTWYFDARNQITAPNLVTETTSFDGLVAMDFSERMPALASISSITSVTIADEVGETEPTVGTTEISSDSKKVHAAIDCASATAGTYTVTMVIVTSDSQTIVGKGRLVLE